MATPDSNFLELQRRLFGWSAITTLDDGVTPLTWDADPNTVVNGNSPGETKLYAMPPPAVYFQSNGTYWFKTALPNTWVQPGGVPVSKYIETGSLAPGDHTLNDATNWAIKKAQIMAARVQTLSTDWDLWIYVGTFDATALTTIRVTEDPDNVYAGDQDLSVNRQYAPGDVNVKVRFTDNAGANNFKLRLEGEERS
jgi:hypothetical protein